MAAEVWRALSAGTRLAVEAGTGVGKSLAYLVPAAHWVRQTHRRIAISTYTRILQSQLVTNDVPLLKLVLDDPPAIAVAYGQENYLCRLRLNTRISRGLFDTRAQARAADRLRRVYQPGGVLGEPWPTGATALWAAILLLAYLVLYS